MKQFTRFWSLCGGYCFLAILLFASCNANDDDLSNNSKEKTERVTLSLNITPDGWNNQTTTRASYSTLVLLVTKLLI